MRFDLGDLLGLAFLFFFVILPAIQSFTRRRPPVDMPDEVEYNLPDKSKGETNLPRPPSSTQPPTQRPVAQQTQPQQPRPASPPARPPAPRQPASPPAPQPRPMVTEPNKPKPVQRGTPQRGKTLEQLENERLKRQPVVHEAFTLPPAPAAVVEVGEIRRPQSKPLATDPDAILKGMIWQQVLGEPRGQHWSKLRRSK